MLAVDENNTFLQLESIHLYAINIRALNPKDVFNAVCLS